MNLRKLEYFFEVARQKSFTKAAKTCFVSQTAVSQQIASLEDELGIDLFVRDNKNVDLTPAGETFLHGAIGAVEQYNNSVAKAREVADGYRGILRVGFFSAFDRSILVPILNSFCKLSPQVKMNILQCDFESMSRNLLHGVVDVGFIFDIDAQDESEFNKLCVQRSVAGVCMRHDNPLASKDTLTLADLKDQNILSFNRNPRQSRIKDFSYEHEKVINSNLPFCTNAFIENIDSVLLLVQAGLGISFAPDIRTYLGDELVFRPLNEPFIYFECNAIYRKNNQSPVLKAFIRAVQDR